MHVMLKALLLHSGKSFLWLDEICFYNLFEYFSTSSNTIDKMMMQSKYEKYGIFMPGSFVKHVTWDSSISLLVESTILWIFRIMKLLYTVILERIFLVVYSLLMKLQCKNSLKYRSCLCKFDKEMDISVYMCVCVYVCTLGRKHKSCGEDANTLETLI